MNKISLIGRLTKDVEVSYTQNTNKAVAKFSIAVNRKFAKGDVKADFINIVAWDKTAEFCSKYFAKGQQIAVCGRLETRTYEKEGRKIYVTEIIAEEVYFADSKKENSNNNNSAEPAASFFETVNDDDLPF